MEHTGPQVHSTCEVAPVNENGATPFSQHTVVLTKQAYIELKWQANYWRAQHERFLKREAALQAEVAALQATIRDLTQRLYGGIGLDAGLAGQIPLWPSHPPFL